MYFSSFVAALVPSLALMTLRAASEDAFQYNFPPIQARDAKIPDVHRDTSPSHAIGTVSCKDIAVVDMPKFVDLIAVGAFTCDLTINRMYDGATVMYINTFKVELGVYERYMIVTVGNHFATLHADFSRESVNFTNCETGDSLTWFMHSYNITRHGSYYCMFTCNEEKLSNFLCASTVPRFLTQQSKAVVSVQQVYGVHKLHSARTHVCKNNNMYLHCPITSATSS